MRMPLAGSRRRTNIICLAAHARSQGEGSIACPAACERLRLPSAGPVNRGAGPGESRDLGRRRQATARRGIEVARDVTSGRERAKHRTSAGTAYAAHGA